METLTLILKAFAALVAVPGLIIGSYVVIRDSFAADELKIDITYIAMILIVIFLFIL